jgi:serine/threonine-protein kinase
MLCGEQLTLPMANGIYPGQILGDRYLISRQLAQGGFGRTYLAEDTNRFNELCVLKEFAPQAQSNTILKKAEELFEREAGVLYKLEHPQIPRFRELFRVNLNGKVHLFLVQDYVEGETYRTLLESRLQQKKQFSEAEVIHLMLQILPVLSYIHALGVIHRDISPENLILRREDRLPMLIDFGGVKQVAATVVSQFKQPVRTNSPATLLGKVGYAPYEQIQTGIVYPHSDLYALAATVLVLLTGKEPQELIDERTLTWSWRREIHLSSALGTLLDKMLSPRLSDRPVSAQQVLQALSSNNAANQHFTPPTGVTVAIAPANHPPAATLPSIPFPVDVASKVSSTVRKNWLVFPTAIVAVGVGWLVVSSWFQFQSAFLTSKKTPGTTTQKQASSIPTPKLSAAELQRKNQLRDRRQQLGINNKFYTALVDRAFWEKYSDRQGRRLSLSPEDEALRTEWDNIAAQQLDRLQPLSPELRKQLGTYSGLERSRWRKELYKLHLSSRALYDLADAAFLAMFPQYKGKNYMNQPISQVWYALADEKFKAILAGTAYEHISFDPGTTDKQVGGSLKPGEGKAYVAELTKEQMMKLDLQADPQILISVYSPTGKIKLMQGSSDRAWSGKLPESGFYEFVVVSTASQPVDYQLKITAEPTSSAESSTASPLKL